MEGMDLVIWMDDKAAEHRKSEWLGDQHWGYGCGCGGAQATEEGKPTDCVCLGDGKPTGSVPTSIGTELDAHVASLRALLSEWLRSRISMATLQMEVKRC